MRINKRILIGVVLALMILMVPLALASSVMYVSPEIKNLNCGENDTIEVRITTDEVTQIEQAYIHFNPECINITDVNYTGSPWQPLSSPSWLNFGDYVTSASAEYGGVEAGDYLYVTLTIECVCDNGDCVSDIWFDNLAPTYPTTNGIVICETPLMPCLGDCYSATGALIASDIQCYECIGIEDGITWENYEFDSPCSPNTTVPRRIYDYCPECCDGIDNGEGDFLVDYPNDPECSCCLDETEDIDEGCPGSCVPEMMTIVLVAIGIFSIALLMRKRE